MKKLLKNKKFWAALAVAVSALGGYQNPEAITAVGEIVGVVVEANESAEAK